MKSFPSRKTLADECGMGIKTLDRSMQKLVELGYIVKTTRTNKEEHLTNLYEVVIFDTQPPSAKLTPPKVASKRTPPTAKKDIENSTHLTQPINTSTNVLVGADAPAVYGKPEINELFNYWELKTGLPISAKVRANRNACNNLNRKYGAEKMAQLIDGVAIAQGERYAPQISDFCDLQEKLNRLLTWGKARQTNQKKVIKI